MNRGKVDGKRHGSHPFAVLHTYVFRNVARGAGSSLVPSVTITGFVPPYFIVYFKPDTENSKTAFPPPPPSPVDVSLPARPSRPQPRPTLKVILMSATLDTARFAAYFSGIPGLPGGKTPIMHIPGRTFPVRDLYLEDALAATGHRPRLKRKVEKPKSGPQAYDGGGAAGAGKGSGGDGDDDGRQDEATGGGGAREGERRRPGGLEGPSFWLDGEESGEDDDEELAQQERERGALGGLDMDRVDEQQLDYQLLVSLVLFAISHEGERYLGLRDDGGGEAAGSEGSVLVFMPGTMEIDRLCRELEYATEGQSLWVLPLHGSLPPQKQRQVFDPPPRGTRKVVVSTNIAETSITIPDVTVVLDSCRVKEMGYDVARQMPRLQESWASQDSLTQRKGRAGRVRKGVSFKLIRRRTFNKLPVHGTPEIRRVPLDHLVLQIKALGVEDHPSVVLARALDPPDPKAVQDAVDTLTDLKALGDGAVSVSTYTGPHGECAWLGYFLWPI